MRKPNNALNDAHQFKVHFPSFQQKNKKSRKEEEEVEDKIDPTWEYGRKFVSALLDQCNADIRAVIKEKTYQKTEEKPTKAVERYHDSNIGIHPLSYLRVINV